MRNLIYLAPLILMESVCLRAAQAPAGNRAIGAVTAIDAGAKLITIKTDASLCMKASA